jgi:hypothetical protein
MIAQAVRCIGHPGEPEIGTVSENGGHQRQLIRCRIAGAQMRESIGEPGPDIDIAQDIGARYDRPSESCIVVGRNGKALQVTACPDRQLFFQPIKERRIRWRNDHHLSRQTNSAS